MKKLSQTVKNRPVAILVHGTSIAQLEDRIEDFKEFDLCYASVNLFSMLEKRILGKIGKKFEMVYCVSQARMEQELGNIKEFVRRDSSTFITTNKIDLPDTKVFYNKKPMLFWNTLSRLIELLVRARVKDIFLFGADGGAIGRDIYYAQDEFRLNERYEKMENKYICIRNDTTKMNNELPKILGNHNTRILNVSPESHINCFTKIDYDGALNILNKELKWQLAAEKK